MTLSKNLVKSRSGDEIITVMTFSKFITLDGSNLKCVAYSATYKIIMVIARLSEVPSL